MFAHRTKANGQVLGGVYNYVLLAITERPHVFRGANTLISDIKVRNLTTILYVLVNL